MADWAERRSTHLCLIRHGESAAQAEGTVGGMRGGDYSEDVHQARVAVRRLRSDLRTFAELLEPEWLDGLRGDLRWLAAELGGVRDVDVLLGRLQEQQGRLPEEDAGPASHLVGLLKEDLAQVRLQLQDVLDSERYMDLIERLVSAANAPASRSTAKKRATGVLPSLVARPWRRLRRTVEALPVSPTPASLHRVRILAKRCRYAAEAVAPVVGKRAARFARATAQVQSVPGEHQDSVRFEAWLREPGRPAEVAFVAGELLAWRWSEQMRGPRPRRGGEIGGPSTGRSRYHD